MMRGINWMLSAIKVVSGFISDALGLNHQTNTVQNASIIERVGVHDAASPAGKILSASLSDSFKMSDTETQSISLGNVYPVSVVSASWTATAQVVYDLASTDNTGYRTAPTKVVGVDALPSGATISGSTLTLGGSGGTFSGWTVGNYAVNVTVSGWIIEDNLFSGGAAVTVYGLNITASNTTVRYNIFDGNYGQNLRTAIAMSGSITGVSIYRNRVGACASDSIKIVTSTTDLTDRPQFYENYMTVGAWGSPGAHFDCITVALGGANIYSNHFNLTSYIDPAYTTNPPQPLNSPPLDAPAGFYTYGLTNAVRNQCDAAGGTLGNVTIHNNIIYGHKRAGSAYVSQIVDNQIEGAFVITDNIIEEGYHNGVMYPAFPADATFSLAFTGNTRWSDGATFTTTTGSTAVVPSAPILALIDSITTSSFRVRYDRAGDTGANGNHQYALSTDGGETWGAWLLLSTSTNVITGLLSATNYSVKLRGKNSYGYGVESVTLTATTS